MTREGAITVLNMIEAHGSLAIQAKDMAVKALEQEPCDDCISRQAVLDLIADYDLSMGQVVKGIHALPSVTPQEPILDKIRAEIEALPKTYPFANHIDMYVKENDVKNIIDKYKAEIIKSFIEDVEAVKMRDQHNVPSTHTTQVI